MVSRIRDQIEALIVDGALPGGSHVVESAVALRLGTSRGLVREACRALVEAGLLVAYPNRGCFVREISLRDAVELYEVRAALGRLAGMTLAEHVTAPQLAELAQLVAEMEEAGAQRDLRRFHDINAAFHDRIIALSGNRRLQALHAALLKELSISRRRQIFGGGGIAAANAEHREIHAALADRDPVRAGDLLERHIQRAKLRFLEAMGREE
nr:GntR family transcriptional regulator [Plastoroseomonas hellenica]